MFFFFHFARNGKVQNSSKKGLSCAPQLVHLTRRIKIAFYTGIIGLIFPSPKGDSLPSGFPYFRTEPKTKAVEIDHTALLVCDARGNPEPQITWYKDQRPVDQTNPRYMVLTSGKYTKWPLC